MTTQPYSLESDDHRKIRRIVRWLGRAILFLIGFAVPAGISTMVILDVYWDRLDDTAAAAETIVGHIYQTPDFWQFQTERLEGLLEGEARHAVAVDLVLKDENGLIARSHDTIGSITLTACGPVTV